MKRMCILLLTVLLTVLAGDICAQMPAKAFRSWLKQPAKFPRTQLGELSEVQLDQLLTRITQETARINLKNQRELLRQARVFETSRPAIFRALSKQITNYHSLSGTVFKTTYAGQREIFGVIPTHVLQDATHTSGLLSKEFSVAVQTEQGFKILPARVVQLSSAKTGDVALVKFRAEDEALLSPLALSRAALKQFPQHVYAQGYARSIMTQSSFPLVGTTSAGTLLAQLPAANFGERTGLCGSPVLSANATLAGIHVGSNYTAQDLPSKTDVGYVTPASFLKQLVEAYHQPGLKPVVIELDGKEMTRLAVDEYISQIELLDKQQHVLWSKTTQQKVSFRQAQAALHTYPNVAFVRFQIGKTQWTQDAQGWFVQDNDSVSSMLIPL